MILLDTAGQVVLGDADGEPLFRVRAAAFVEEEVFLLEMATNRILRYSTLGSHLGQFAGRGEGPAEFTDPVGITAIGDTILAWDETLRKVVRFSTDGKVLGVVSLLDVAGQGMGAPVGVLADGRVVMSRGVPAATNGAVPVLSRGFGALTLFSPGTQERRDFGDFPFREFYRVPLDGGGMTILTPIFQRHSGLVVGKDVVASLGRVDHTIEIRPASDTLVVLGVDSMLRRRALGDSEWNAALRTLKQEAKRGEVSGLLDVILKLPRPDSMPYWGWQGSPFVRVLRIDRADRVWALQYGVPSDGYQQWTVFSTEGKVVARVRVPGEVNILGFNNDSVVLQRWDEDGIEVVTIAALPSQLSKD